MENEFTMSQYASKDDLIAAMRERIEDLEDTVQFCERWAVHHGSKPSLSAQEALSCIQHYPVITEVTESYADGNRPDTFNPFARIADLETQVAHMADLVELANNATERADKLEAQVKQLQRVPLSDEQIMEQQEKYVGGPTPSYPLGASDWIEFARAIEAAHNIK